MSDIGHVGFATRRVSSWTLATRYELTGIQSDGRYADLFAIAKRKRRTFEVFVDDSNSKVPWVTLRAASSADDVLVLDHDGVRIATIHTATHVANPDRLLALIDERDQTVLEVRSPEDPSANPLDLDVRADARRVGGFTKLSLDSCALSVTDFTALDTRLVAALVVHLHERLIVDQSWSDAFFDNLWPG